MIRVNPERKVVFDKRAEWGDGVKSVRNLDYESGEGDSWNRIGFRNYMVINLFIDKLSIRLRRYF